MFYTLRMDAEEASWIVNLLKRLQTCHVINTAPEISDLDVERAASFISRIRATMRAK